MADSLRGLHTTLTTSIISSLPTLESLSEDAESTVLAWLSNPDSMSSGAEAMRIQRVDSAINGVVIGLLSSFGSAVLIAFVFLIVYFLRYTSSGRILLDRIGRPGQYDDEQAFAREEAEALEEMDDLQRTEYLRAKGALPHDTVLCDSRHTC
jgi:hypothetical protein